MSFLKTLAARLLALRAAQPDELAAELLRRVGEPRIPAGRLDCWSERRLTMALGRVNHHALLKAIQQVRAEHDPLYAD